MNKTYKLLPIALLTLSCLANAASTQEEIVDTKAQIEKLQANLKKLEETQAALPKNIEQTKAAELAKIEKENELKTHAEFGFINTTGNTDTTSYNLNLKMKKGWDKHILEYVLDAQYADDNSVETKNKMLTELEYDYQITSRFAFNYLLGYKKDRFSGYDYQMYTGPGAKYKAIKEKKHNLSLEGNILYAEDHLEDTTYTTGGDVINYPNAGNLVADPSLTVLGSTDTYTSFRAKAAYEWQILENLKFTQDLSYRTKVDESKRYFVYSESALISKLSDVFSLGVNYKVDYVNLAPQGKENTDKTFSVNLIIDY